MTILIVAFFRGTAFLLQFLQPNFFVAFFDQGIKNATKFYSDFYGFLVLFRPTLPAFSVLRSELAFSGK